MAAHRASHDPMTAVSPSICDCRPNSAGRAAGPTPNSFAAGYAACFHGALSLIAQRDRIDIRETTVAVEVAFGRDPVDGGYALTANITIRMPGVDRQVAERLVRDTERLCPYSKMARQGICSVVAVSA